MLNEHVIFLIGLPGSGKSFWARQLAKELGLLQIDLDDYISENAGMSISEIFSLYGENHFRELEANALKEIVRTKKYNIVACGGGTPMFFDNMNFMKTNGFVIFIDAPLEEIEERIQYKPHSRPLLSSNPKEKLQELHLQRNATYSKAHVIVPTETLTLNNFVQKLKLCINKD